MNALKSSRKFEGVFYRESKRRLYNGRPDRSFTICYSQHCKKYWLTLGWASLGVTAESAYQTRLDILRKLRLGQTVLPQKNDMTVAPAIKKYLTWAKAENQHTKTYQSLANHWIIPHCGNVPLSLLDQTIIDALKAKLQAGGLAPGTVRHTLALLQVSINHVIKRKLWQGTNPISPAGGCKLPPKGEKCERFLTLEEAKLLLAELKTTSPLWHDMALVSLHTGLRLTELFKIKGQDIDEGSSVATITAKGGARETIALTRESLEALLRNRRTPSDLLFCRKNGSPLKGSYDTPFTHAVKACGFNDGITGNRHKVWFHTLRHTFASWLAQDGVDIYAIMKLMRHKNIEMTQRYAHLIPEKQREHLDVIRRRFNSSLPA
jgi:integrase